MISIIQGLYDIGAIRIGKFKLKSGEYSPFYLDLRLIPSHPKLFQMVVNEYCKQLDKLDYIPDAIAGIMSAGIPFATGIALERQIPLLQIRSEIKEHGTKKMIEGTIPETGSKVVLIDDLISTGVSKLIPKDVLVDKRLNVTDLIVLIDRTNKKGKEALENANLNLHSAFSLNELLEELLNIDIPKNEYQIIEKVINDWQS